jgi:hypothetical protein
MVVDDVHGGINVAGAEERLDEERAREGAGDQPALGHFVEQLLRGAGVGDAGVAIEERGVGGSIGSHAHAEVETVREEDGDRRQIGGAAEEAEEAVVVGERRDDRGSLHEAEREEGRARAEEAAQEGVGGAAVEAGRGGEEEEGGAVVRLGGAA